MESSSITSIRSMKTRVFAMVVAIAFVALVASKITLAIQRPNSEKLDQQTNHLDRNTNDITTNNYKYNSNNAGLFTSMQGEFEWNRFMVPGYEPEMIDPDLSIKRDRETGRRLVEEDVLRYGTIRGGLRNGD